MEIKKKVKESVSKAKEWCLEHVEEITVGVGVGTIGILGALVGYSIGSINQEKYDTKVFNDLWPDDQKLVSIPRIDTGKLEGIVTERLFSAIQNPDELIRYDDGSWDYASDVQK